MLSDKNIIVKRSPDELHEDIYFKLFEYNQRLRRHIFTEKKHQKLIKAVKFIKSDEPPPRADEDTVPVIASLTHPLTPAAEASATDLNATDLSSVQASATDLPTRALHVTDSAAEALPATSPPRMQTQPKPFHFADIFKIPVIPHAIHLEAISSSHIVQHNTVSPPTKLAATV
jgi:hypothetical protein